MRVVQPIHSASILIVKGNSVTNISGLAILLYLTLPGLPHYSTGDIQRIYRDYKSYQERCRVALVEWIDCSATENGLQLLIQALKDADMGKEAEKVLKEFGTPAGTDQNGDYLDMRNIPAVEVRPPNTAYQSWEQNANFLLLNPICIHACHLLMH